MSAATVGFALLTSAATFLPAQPAAAMPDRGAAAVAGILADMSVAEPAQYYRRGITARRAAVTTRRVYRRTVRRAAVVAAVPAAAATVQPATYSGWSGFGWPFWSGRPGLYGSYASAAIPAAAITTPTRVIRIGNWVRPREYWWQPGGAIAAGAAWAAWPATSASLWVGTAPDANLCWYRTGPIGFWWVGFWDVCQTSQI